MAREQLGRIALLATLCGLIINTQPISCWEPITTALPSAPVATGGARLLKIPLHGSTSMTAGSLGQPVINYYTSVNIGTPAKSFYIQFDTDLHDSFVPHYEWSPFKTNLHYGKGFQCKVSSTCKKTDRNIAMDYQRCKLTGKPYEDLLTLLDTQANSHSYPVTLRQNFLAISDASDARFKNLPVDGFFGLSPQTYGIATTNLLGSLHNAGFIDNLQFSIWINPVLDSPQGGEITLGGVDVNRFRDKIYWHPVSATSSRWSIGLRMVMLGQHTVSTCQPSGPNKCEAVVSSGTNEIHGPKADVSRIYALLNTTRQPSTGLELIDCRRLTQLPVLIFQIDGIPYALVPSNYVRRMTTGSIFKTETCYVAILPDLDPSNTSRWTLGTNFLGSYYSIFDMTYRQVGFASLR